MLAAWAAAAEALFVAPRDDAAGNAAALAALETLTAPLTHTNSFPKHVIADEPQPKRPKPVEDAASSTPMDVDAVKEAPAAAAPAAAAAEVLAPTLPDETKSQMSEYELAREAKIAANQQMLIELGIVDAKATISAAAAAQKKQRAPKKQPAQAGPARRSSRASAGAKAETEENNSVMEPPPTGGYLWVRFTADANKAQPQWHRAMVIKRTNAKSWTQAEDWTFDAGMDDYVASGRVTKEVRPATATVRYLSDGSEETMTFPDTSGDVVAEEPAPSESLIAKQPGGEIRRTMTQLKGWGVKAALRHVPGSAKAPASVRHDRSDLFPQREETWVAVAQCTPQPAQQIEATAARVEMVQLRMVVTWLSPTAVSFQIERPTADTSSDELDASTSHGVSLQPVRSEMTVNIPGSGGTDRDICIIDDKVVVACATTNSPHALVAILLWCNATFPSISKWVVPTTTNNPPLAMGFTKNRIDGSWTMQL